LIQDDEFSSSVFNVLKRSDPSDHQLEVDTATNKSLEDAPVTQMDASNLKLDDALWRMYDALSTNSQDLLKTCFKYLVDNKEIIQDKEGFPKNVEFQESKGLWETLNFTELKLLAKEDLKYFVLVSKNPSYLFDINMTWDDFMRHRELLTQIFTEESTNTALVNLKISDILDFSSVAEFLQSGSKIKSLDLSGNEIGDEDATQIAAALKENKTLISLDLGFNKIGDEAAALIEASLKENRNRTHFL